MGCHTKLTVFLNNATSRKLFTRDIILNVFASGLPVLVLQFFVLPSIAAKNGEVAYGLIVTVLGIITIGSETIGNSLNNTRLLQQVYYEKRVIEGDFNRLLLYGCVVDVFVVSIGFVYCHITLSDFPLLILVALLVLMRMYYIVAFRIKLDYTGILINGLLLSVGYAVGYYLYIYLHKWELIYITANVAALAHIFLSTDIFYESLTKTVLYRDTWRRMIGIYGADVTKTCMTYADRLIIFPVLGAIPVANYYAASIMGKMISLLVTPVGSVLLSYIVKKDKLNKLMLAKAGILSLAMAGPCYITILYLGRIMLAILYPSMNDTAKHLLPWISVAAVLIAFSSLLQPVALRYKGVRFQLYVNVCCLLLYLVVSFVGIKLSGIVGFCISYCVVLLMRLILYTIGLLKA